MSVATVTDQPKRPLPSRKVSCTAAGRAGVDDLVQLLGTMDVLHPNSKTTAKVAPVQGTLRRPQDSSRISSAPELRLNAPSLAVRHLSKPERRPLSAIAAPTNPPPPQTLGLKPGKTPLPTNKQSKLLSSALLTPPEMRKIIR
ncbi:hypothetical protein GGI21_005535 [Coemansia aciculifera]|nr:hypothetical protein GGI21_005535 [Coemansia aciculifera]